MLRDRESTSSYISGVVFGVCWWALGFTAILFDAIIFDLVSVGSGGICGRGVVCMVLLSELL